MGRGEVQMSISCAIEKSARGPDIRSMASQRRLVVIALLAALLPFVITRSYLYYTGPDASTAAMLFFQRPPLSSPSPFKVEPKMGMTVNITGSLDANSAEAAMVEDAQAKEHMDPIETTGMSGNETSAALESSGQEQANVTTAEMKINSTSPSVNATDANSAEAAMVEDAQAKELNPIETTGMSGNETSAVFESSGQKQANVTTVKMKINSTSPSVNATDVSKQTSDDNSSIHQPELHLEMPKGENATVVAMEGQGVTSTTNPGASKGAEVCDLVKGSWVPDPRPPQYTNASCNFIQGFQNCIKNGRPDMRYLQWKWQPDHCELPRIDTQAFLTAMRDRSMIFAGDSLARNQFQSLLCLLSQVEMPDHTYQAPTDKDNIHVFRTYNFTIANYWSPYLMHVEDKEITWPNSNRTEVVAHIHLDKFDKAWFERVSGVDILQISTGQWWTKRALFLLGGQPIGGHICDGWAECTREIGFADPYRIGIHNLFQSSLSIPGFNGTIVFRTFAPDHFEGGSWNQGGKCNRTAPGGVPMNYVTQAMYEIQLQEFQNVTGASSISEVHHRLRLLDVTSLAQLRADGHPDAYREPFPKDNMQPITRDCLHWCLPGPIDTWNDLLVESLHDRIYR